MKVMALRSFGGAVNMSRGQVMNIQDEYVLNDLLKAGYVEALEEANTQTNAILDAGNDAESKAESDGEPKAESDGEPKVENDGEEILTGTLDTEELQEMHYNDLKKLAKEMKLDASGTKDELVERIAAAKVNAGVVE